MLKSLRRKFILSAMTAFLLVLLLASAAIVGWDYTVTTGKLDNMLGELRAVQSGFPVISGSSMLPTLFRMLDSDPESRYTTRFFSAVIDGEGKVVSVFTDFIGSVDESSAKQFALSAANTGKDRGFEGNYRWLRYNEGPFTRMVFLNAATELRSMRSVVSICILVLVTSLLPLFLLVSLFSHRAIRPFAANLERQKRFITDAGHELKTPLTSISTSADVLALDHEDDEWVQNIRAQCVKLGRLIGNLIMLSRLDEAQPLPERAPFSLSEAARELEEAFEKQALAAGKKLVPEIGGDIFVTGDIASVKELISVLLDNAVKYADPGSTVDFRVTTKRGHAVIETENLCMNADAIDTSRIFDRFYRPDESRSEKTGGYGIGLSIARAVMEAHGGKITACIPSEGRIRFTAVF